MEDIQLDAFDIWYARVDYEFVMRDGSVVCGRDVFPVTSGVHRIMHVLCGLLGIRVDDVKGFKASIEL